MDLRDRPDPAGELEQALEPLELVRPVHESSADAIGQLVTWADSHLEEIDAARAAYDARHPAE